MTKSIYDLELHEVMEVEMSDTDRAVISRVPGGWIYLLQVYDLIGRRDGVKFVFVPYNEEFKEKGEKK